MTDEELARQVRSALQDLFPDPGEHANPANPTERADPADAADLVYPVPVAGRLLARPAGGRLLAVGAATAASAIVAALAIASSLPSTPAASGTGVVTGLAPICYGPGPDTNLKPTVIIRAVRTDGLRRTTTEHVSNNQHTYRLTLPAGRYTISAYSGQITATIRAHHTTRHADLPQPGCF